MSASSAHAITSLSGGHIRGAVPAHSQKLHCPYRADVEVTGVLGPIIREAVPKQAQHTQSSKRNADVKATTGRTTNAFHNVLAMIAPASAAAALCGCAVRRRARTTAAATTGDRQTRQQQQTQNLACACICCFHASGAMYDSPAEGRKKKKTLGLRCKGEKPVGTKLRRLPPPSAGAQYGGAREGARWAAGE